MTTEIAVRSVPSDMTNGSASGKQIEDYEEYDDNSSSRLFERSRIRALAG